MDAILLLFECGGIFLVMTWLARGRGEAGLLGWRRPNDPKPPEAARIPRR